MPRNIEVSKLKEKGYKTLNEICKKCGRKTSIKHDKLPEYLKKLGLKIKASTYYSIEEQKLIEDWIKISPNEKRKKTFMKKYNVNCFSKLSLFKETISKLKRSNTELFIEKAKKKHKEDYDYSKTKYGKNAYEKVEIICPKKHTFFMTPHNFLRGQNCPECSKARIKSIGEEKIENYLKEKNIEYIAQKRFFFIKNKRTLPIDFYLPNHNIAIEFQGRQHFEKVEFFKNDLDYQKNNDKIKKDCCIENDIVFVEIKYNEDIKNILDEYLEEK